MREPNWKDQDLGTVDGFRMVLRFGPEWEDMEEHFKEFCGWNDDEYHSIEDHYWFTASIIAYHGRIECGSSYLGACCYASLDEVMQDGKLSNILSGYAPQMIREAIKEARQNLSEALEL